MIASQYCPVQNHLFQTGQQKGARSMEIGTYLFSWSDKQIFTIEFLSLEEHLLKTNKNLKLLVAQMYHVNVYTIIPLKLLPRWHGSVVEH